jgi:hypothetical protein
VAAGGLETADRRQECDRLKTVKLAVDANGSPITLQAQSWLVCFVPGLKKQWWHPFVHKRHKHVFVMRPAGPGAWTLFEPWWHRILVATITSEQARKFPLWGARGDVLLVRVAIPGRGSQMRGWMNCAALASYLLGRTYWVWAPHGLYKHLLHEPNVCRVDVSTLLELDAANKLAAGSRVVAPCDECRPGMPNRCEGAAKPFCMNCGRDLEADESVSTNGWFPPARVRSWARVHEAAGRDVRSR